MNQLFELCSVTTDEWVLDINVVFVVQVGRIIGKGGQNVRELQRYTGASVKVPEQGDKGEEDKTRERDVSVHIVGNFFAVQVCPRSFSHTFF